MKKVQGFTLIELVIVIVILGILSAVALPRFINVTTQARTASVDGLAGGLRAGMSLAKAQFMVNADGLSPVNMDGTNVTVDTTFGFPTGDAAGIVAAMQSIDGFTPTYAAGPPTVATLRPDNGGSATCQAAYTASTATVPASVTVTTTGC